MSYDQQYTFLDGKWHAIGWSEHTQCNLEIPIGNGYSLLPEGEKAHCGPDTKIAETTVEDADPAANKAIADQAAAERAAQPVETVTGEAAAEYAAEPEPSKPTPAKAKTTSAKAPAKTSKAKGGKVA